jgi:hypothetical protein
MMELKSLVQNKRMIVTPFFVLTTKRKPPALPGDSQSLTDPGVKETEAPQGQSLPSWRGDQTEENGR